ncbi:MAG: alpha/beta hydrolase-fold protein [Gemmatimonadota bacterium]|nr:alpha/beta hydrolase-fold protein [Gemmatimonadota bacterium]MDH4351819.1 alpha/beta hydrolase-fold protein [Gemmatimonadota bacterium]
MRYPAVAACCPALLAAVLGCGESIAPFDGVHDFQLEVPSGETTRTAVVHIPPSYDGTRRFPLVLAFHGSFGSGQEIQGYTGLDRVADDLGFIVAYPDATPNWDYEGARDLDFTLDLIDALSARLGITTDRVYATGVSRGGLFALHLACDVAERFAAVGIVVATLREDLADRCRPRERLSTVLVVGTLDGSTPIDGEPQFGYLSADATIRLFAGRNGCDLGRPPTVTYAPDTVDDGLRIRFEVFQGCDDGTGAERWVVEGGTHADGWYLGDVDTGRLLAEFFLSHHR